MFRRSHRVAAVVLLCACGGGTADNTKASDTAAQAVTVPRFSNSDFEKLRFVEGSWRGSAEGVSPFYETYRFVDDSTIDMTAWTDSTMSIAKEHSQYLLRDGVIRTDKGASLVKSDAEGFHFKAATYAWTFTPSSPDRWNATVGSNTTYSMDRIVPKQ